MALTVNTNVSALNGQRVLNSTQGSLATSMQRLSSGLRINSAKDDSAGLAISERFTAQIRGNDQAARNANDAISLAQTAEGDLDQIGESLQRIRELAVQSANATNSASDRQSINNEASQLLAEIDRIASGSSFNGTNLLDGTFTSKNFQVGANNTANDRITISSISSAKTSALGTGSTSSVTGTSGVTNIALTANELTINGQQVGASLATYDTVSSTGNAYSAISKATAINAVSSKTGVTATVNATAVQGATTISTTAGAAGAVTINGISLGTVTFGTSAAGNGQAGAAAVNAVTAQTGVTATFNTTTGAIALSAADGRNITIAGAGVADYGFTAATSTAALTLSSTGSITLGGDAAQTDNIASLGTGIAVGTVTPTTSSTQVLSSIDLSSASGSTSALATIDAAISSINTSRGALGAFQNRFEATVSNLATKTENLSASRGRIQDADFAKETANLSRAQVLQQAGTAMLAQANQSSQGVLSLLR